MIEHIPVREHVAIQIHRHKTGELQKGLENAVQKLSPNETTSVIPANGGFQIVKVLKKRLIPDPRTEKDRDKIRAELYEASFKKQMASSWQQRGY